MLVSSYHSRRASPYTARNSIVSNNVWDVIEFVLNGIVFVLLGMQLPGIFEGDWTFGTLDVQELILISLAVTALLVLVRFV